MATKPISVLQEFAKQSLENGTLKAKTKKAFTISESYDDNIMTVCAALREQGLPNHALLIEQKYVAYKRAEAAEKNEVLDKAHPQKDVKVTDSTSDESVMVGIETTHDRLLDIANKIKHSKIDYSDLMMKAHEEDSKKLDLMSAKIHSSVERQEIAINQTKKLARLAFKIRKTADFQGDKEKVVSLVNTIKDNYYYLVKNFRSIMGGLVGESDDALKSMLEQVQSKANSMASDADIADFRVDAKQLQNLINMSKYLKAVKNPNFFVRYDINPLTRYPQSSLDMGAKKADEIYSSINSIVEITSQKREAPAAPATQATPAAPNAQPAATSNAMKSVAGPKINLEAAKQKAGNKIKFEEINKDGFHYWKGSYQPARDFYIWWKLNGEPGGKITDLSKHPEEAKQG